MRSATTRKSTVPCLRCCGNWTKVLDANVSLASDVSRRVPRRLSGPITQIVALQQLARNAVLHRTYEATNAPSRVYWFSDRIEIHSPGGLFGRVNAENFGEPDVTDYRNPSLAEAMKVSGTCSDRHGHPAGQERTRKERQSTLELTTSPTAVLATIRSAHENDCLLQQ